MDERKQKMLFCLILLVLVVAVWYRIMHPYVQPRVAELTHTGNKSILTSVLYPLEKKTGGLKKTQTYSNSVFDQFFNQPFYSGDVINDIFAGQFGGNELINSPKKTDHGPADGAEERPPVDPVPQALDRLKKTVDYLLSFTFLGGFQSGEEKAIFLSRNNLVLVARIGDRINGKYLIEAIEEDSITIKALDINETLHLEMRLFNDKEE
ncbi:MAG: hypothetical protein QM498_04415 [Desulfobacterium sp.]